MFMYIMPPRAIKRLKGKVFLTIIQICIITFNVAYIKRRKNLNYCYHKLTSLIIVHPLILHFIYSRLFLDVFLLSPK
jgi:hypothetical protein